jgi:hypothetical protein
LTKLFKHCSLFESFSLSNHHDHKEQHLNCSFGGSLRTSWQLTFPNLYRQNHHTKNKFLKLYKGTIFVKMEQLRAEMEEMRIELAALTRKELQALAKQGILA